MINIPDETTLAKIGKQVATFILVCALCLICYLFYRIFTIAPEDRDSHVMQATEKARFEKLLRKHGLQGQITLIEVADDGSLWFERGGRKCSLISQTMTAA